MSRKRVDQVFGVSNQILPDSYVDRGSLDADLARLLGRTTHVALRGESKCGKSWLRQKMIPNAIVVQCRLHKSTTDIYVDALSQLGIRLEIERNSATSFKGRVSATAEAGFKLLARLKGTAESEAGHEKDTRTAAAGHDVNDLRFVADLIRESNRRLVIEDFHYLSVDHRREFAFDLKALWDYGVFVVVIGVWSLDNMVLFLNPDLTGRVHELSIYWSPEDLGAILDRGGSALKLQFSADFKDRIVRDAYGNAGILQSLALKALDVEGIEEEQALTKVVRNLESLEAACLEHAEQLRPFYHQFADRVSNGIRKRADSTNIYAHAMAVIMEISDDDLLLGVGIDVIYREAVARESRIQQGNLRTVLGKFESLQVDDEGRGLVLAYNDSTRRVSVVDRQLLLYRKYATTKWPWEDLIAEGSELDGDARTDAESQAEPAN